MILKWAVYLNNQHTAFLDIIYESTQEYIIAYNPNLFVFIKYTLNDPNPPTTSQIV